MGRHGAGGGRCGLAAMLIVCLACAIVPGEADGNIGKMSTNVWAYACVINIIFTL